MLFENCFYNLLRGRFFCLWWLVVERGRDNNSATNRQFQPETLPFLKYTQLIWVSP